MWQGPLLCPWHLLVSRAQAWGLVGLTDLGDHPVGSGRVSKLQHPVCHPD